MQLLSWYCFFSIQSSRQQSCSTVCARSTRESFSMDLYSSRPPYQESHSECRPSVIEAPVLQDTKYEWHSISDAYHFARPTNRAPLDLYHGQPSIPQGQGDRNGRIQQRPGHLAEPALDHCELIPVICWLGYVQSPGPPSGFNSLPCARGPETKAAPIHECCSTLPIGFSQPSAQISDPEAAALPSSDPLGPTHIAPPETLQANLGRAAQKSPNQIPQRQFKCTHPGCNRQFRRRAALERHLTCHSDERPYVCWVPECHRAFKRFDNHLAHYPTHGKLDGRNRYVATLDKACYMFDPEFRGTLTPQGWPLQRHSFDT